MDMIIFVAALVLLAGFALALGKDSRPDITDLRHNW